MPELPDDDPRFVEFAIHLSNMLQCIWANRSIGSQWDRSTR
jgi:hypothetical protein